MNNSFSKSNIKSALIGIASLLLLAYLIWETYWYTQVGLIFIKWHTHLMLYVYLGLILFFSYNILSKRESPIVKNVFLALGSVLFSFFILEAFLSITKMYKTYIEQASGDYVSLYYPLMKGQYYTWPADKPHWLHKPEYRYYRTVNSMGFPDPEWRKNKGPHERRILTIGDSFTEGDGAPYDSSYVALMRQMLSSDGDSAYIMNAGVCGSDPFYGYMNLRDRLIAYHPDIVIQSVGTNDMNPDALTRGGMERFQKDGTLKFRRAPWWEPIYAISYSSRIFFTWAGYNQMLQTEDAPPKEKARIDRSYKELFKLYADLCRKNNIRLFVVLHPDRDETAQNTYFYDFTLIVDDMKSDTGLTVIDLLPSYRTYIAARKNTTAADYYWKLDGHHNSKGYLMMAETTLDNITPYLRDTIVTK